MVMDILDRRTPTAIAEPAEGPPSQRYDGDSTSAGPGVDREMAHGAVGALSSDEQAQQDVCAALLTAFGLDPSGIEVGFDRGEVVLSGSVATNRERRLAARIARCSAGDYPVRCLLHARAGHLS
jgi:osmotically-inducible protein OsmY